MPEPSQAQDSAHAEAIDLVAYGWSEFFERQLASYGEAGLPLWPGRIALELRGVLEVVTAKGRVSARVPGRMHHAARTGGELPAVGDWVLIKPPERTGEDGWIERVLERKSKFSRQASGNRTREQVVTANVDRFLVMMGIDGDFKPRRVERYLSSIKEGGAEVSILLNKVDLAEHLAQFEAQVREVAPDTPIHLVSAKHERGLEELAPYLEPGQTLALVGSSGVGKSTLLNRLTGRTVMKTGDVRASDDRGTHTTSHRQLIQLPSGALLIDNPGIRELQAWQSDEGLEETFVEISEIAQRCRFADCQHRQEPDCAVQAALEEGTISKGRLRSYWKLRQEQAVQTERQVQHQRARDRQFTKTVNRAVRGKTKNRYR